MVILDVDASHRVWFCAFCAQQARALLASAFEKAPPVVNAYAVASLPAVALAGVVGVVGAVGEVEVAPGTRFTLGTGPCSAPCTVCKRVVCGGVVLNGQCSSASTNAERYDLDDVHVCGPECGNALFRAHQEHHSTRSA